MLLKTALLVVLLLSVFSPARAENIVLIGSCEGLIAFAQAVGAGDMTDARVLLTADIEITRPLAPIGDASYTLTTTNTAGNTVSKQVYVAKDQVQSVVLAYELILFDGGDNIGVTGGWTYTITRDDYGGSPVRGDNLTVGTTLYWLPGRSWNSEGTDQKNKNGYAHTKNKIDVTNYNTITAVSNYAQGHLTVGNASVALKVGTVSLDISALTGSYEVRLGDTASGDACSKVEISKLYLS